jgi:hypothetical protein
VIRSRAKMRSARANLPKPKATIPVSDATLTSWHRAATPCFGLKPPSRNVGVEGSTVTFGPDPSPISPRHSAARRPPSR